MEVRGGGASSSPLPHHHLQPYITRAGGRTVSPATAAVPGGHTQPPAALLLPRQTTALQHLEPANQSLCAGEQSGGLRRVHPALEDC